jgi:ketosteroid isomerase-like protein
MMNEKENVQVVRQMFAAFDQRDLPGALNTLADDVYWQSPVTRGESKEISWFKPRHNREEVTLFFKDLFEKVQPERMETLGFVAQGDRVIVEGKNRGTVRSTGRAYEHDWVMAITLKEGKIKRVLHYYDTADIIAAFHNK